MASETMGVAEWLYITLRSSTAITTPTGGSAAFRCYEDVAPQGAAWPYVVYSLVSAVDVNAIGGRATVNELWTVKAVAQTNTYNTLRAIANGIDAALNRQRGTATTAGITIAACERTEEVRRTEVSEGLHYRHLGGIYRIYAG